MHTAITTEFANCSDGEIRLVDGSTPNEGRVEVCINQAWGTICGNYYWDSNDANVVCGQLGYLQQGKTITVLCLDNVWTNRYFVNYSRNAFILSTGAVATRNSIYGQGSGPILMSNLNCNGLESTILACDQRTNTYGVLSCSHFQDAGVICEGIGG